MAYFVDGYFEQRFAVVRVDGVIVRVVEVNVAVLRVSNFAAWTVERTAAGHVPT